MFSLMAIGAIALSSLLAAERGFRPNPKTGTFIVQGLPYMPQWSDCTQNPNSTGLQSSPISIEHDFRGLDDHEIRQTLFEYRYADNFGNDTFDVRYDIDAKFDENWNTYLFLPIVSGGGNTGANANIETHLDAKERTITITIRQGFSAQSETNECILKFVSNGERFQFQNAG